MIREDVGIRGIPIPGPDGELTPAPAATRLAPPPHALKERGLVDDTMIALASSESIPPLLRVLDRFEAMSAERRERVARGGNRDRRRRRARSAHAIGAERVARGGASWHAGAASPRCEAYACQRSSI